MRGSQFRNKLLQILLTVELGVSEIILPLVRQSGLTLKQSYVLFIISDRRFITIGQLAQMLHMAQSNISTICKTLEAKGLIQRTRQKEDERIVKIQLTEEGRVLISRLNADFARFDQALDEFSQNKLNLALEGYVAFSDLIRFLVLSKAPKSSTKKINNSCD